MKFLRSLLALALAFSLTLAPPAVHAADVSVTAANVVPGSRARIVTGIAGATITAGQTLYLDSSTSTYKLADANASAATAAVVGIAVSGAASGQYVSVNVEDDDFTPGFTLTTGTVYVLSATAGGIAPVGDLTTGHYPGIVLIAKSTSKAVLKIARGPVAQ